MTIRDVFHNWEGPGVMVAGVLTLRGNAVLPDQTWFLRIVTATVEEQKAIEETGYRLKNA